MEAGKQSYFMTQSVHQRGKNRETNTTCDYKFVTFTMCHDPETHPKIHRKGRYHREAISESRKSSQKLLGGVWCVTQACCFKQVTV